MKKILSCISLTLFMCTVAVAAHAADGAALYKSACASCHGAAGEKGNAPLKDLPADELLQKLKGYGDGSYGGAKKAVMINVVKKHSDEELKAVADHIGKK